MPRWFYFRSQISWQLMSGTWLYNTLSDVKAVLKATHSLLTRSQASGNAITDFMLLTKNLASNFKIKMNAAFSNKIPDFEFWFKLFDSLNKTGFEKASFLVVFLKQCGWWWIACRCDVQMYCFCFWNCVHLRVISCFDAPYSRIISWCTLNDNHNNHNLYHKLCPDNGLHNQQSW